MPDKNLRAVIWLVNTNKRILTSAAMYSGKERGLISRTVTGNLVYGITGEFNCSYLIVKYTGRWISCVIKRNEISQLNDV